MENYKYFKMVIFIIDSNKKTRYSFFFIYSY